MAEKEDVVEEQMKLSEEQYALVEKGTERFIELVYAYREAVLKHTKEKLPTKISDYAGAAHIEVMRNVLMFNQAADSKVRFIETALAAIASVRANAVETFLDKEIDEEALTKTMNTLDSFTESVAVDTEKTRDRFWELCEKIAEYEKEEGAKENG